jgi:hypothetical protein
MGRLECKEDHDPCVPATKGEREREREREREMKKEKSATYKTIIWEPSMILSSKLHKLERW